MYPNTLVITLVIGQDYVDEVSRLIWSVDKANICRRIATDLLFGLLNLSDFADKTCDS